jgi:hypothetical protein
MGENLKEDETILGYSGINSLSSHRFHNLSASLYLLPAG